MADSTGRAWRPKVRNWTDCGRSVTATDGSPPPLADRRASSKQTHNDETREAADAPRENRSRYANLNFNEPSFSIELTISSPAFNHTCLSFGYPRITPSGVPDQMMSPGSSVHILLM